MIRITRASNLAIFNIQRRQNIRFSSIKRPNLLKNEMIYPVYTCMFFKNNAYGFSSNK